MAIQEFDQTYTGTDSPGGDIDSEQAYFEITSNITGVVLITTMHFSFTNIDVKNDDTSSRDDEMKLQNMHTINGNVQVAQYDNYLGRGVPTANRVSSGVGFSEQSVSGNGTATITGPVEFNAEVIDNNGNRTGFYVHSADTVAATVSWQGNDFEFDRRGNFDWSVRLVGRRMV